VANAYKVLGQLVSGAATLETLYTVPAATSVVISSLVAMNKGVSTLIRVAVRPAGAGINDKHYLIYDTTLNANESLILTLGITIAATDVISVYALGAASVSWNLFGTEIT